MTDGNDNIEKVTPRDDPWTIQTAALKFERFFATHLEIRLNFMQLIQQDWKKVRLDVRAFLPRAAN